MSSWQPKPEPVVARNTITPALGEPSASDQIQLMSLHKHSGQMLDGGNLQGPYFLFDSVGVRWRLQVSTAGVLSAVKG